MGETVHIDVETRSLADLKVTGAYRYAQDPSTMVLCMAYAFGDSPVKLWTMDAAPPKDLWAAALDPEVRFAAFNVGFERRIWHFVLHQRLGWPELPVERWHDTQADALAVGFPADLKRCAEALGVEFKKDASGTRLITLLCKPIKGTTRFRGKREFIEQYTELYEYCRQDVRAERAIAKALPIATTADGQERAVWMMTERINDRGVPVDLALAQALWSLIEIDLKDRSVEEITDLTDGQVTSGTQVSRILSLLENPLPDLTAGRVKNTLTCPLLSDHDRALLEARQIASNRSTAKYDRMLKSAGDDGFVRDILQYHGAATGRYAGRGIQIQNFPRESPKDADEIAKFVSNPVYDLIQIEQKYGPVQKIAKKLLRSTIRAPYRHTLVCRDYSSIEAVGTAWTVRDEAQLDSFRAKKDIYIVTAAEMYHIPEETIGKESMERQAGKIAVLACLAEGTQILTDIGLVPIEQVCTCMRVWDGVEWVSHSGTIYQGYKEVMSYDNVSATPDHAVFTEERGKIGLREASGSSARIVQTGIGRTPVWACGDSGFGDESSKWVEEDIYPVPDLWREKMDQLAKSPLREDWGVSAVQPTESCSGLALEEVPGHEGSMREPESPKFQELWSEGDRVSIRDSFCRGPVGNGESRPSTGAGDRPYQQRRALRAGEYPLGGEEIELLEQEKFEGDTLSSIQGEVSRCPLCGQHLKELDLARTDQRGDSEEVGNTKLQTKRQVWDILNAGPRSRFTANGKLVSNCGYQGGWRALRDFALGYGIHWTPKQAWEIVQRFRTARPRLVAAWENFDQAAVMALRRPGVPHLVEGTAFAEFCMLGRHLRMTLANGKAIWFPDAQIRTVTMQYEDPEGNVRSFTREAVTHMWMNTQAQWVRRSIHGGSLFQSYVQAICREIMVEAMLRLESAGWPLIMSVHDEIVALVPKGNVFDPSDFEEIMVRPPEWALDFPIRASGWTGERYRK